VNHDRVQALREHLDANNGIVGLEIVDPEEVERAVRLFDRDGFVVVRDALDADQTAFLKAGVDEVVDDIVALDPDRTGNRGSHPRVPCKSAMSGRGTAAPRTCPTRCERSRTSSTTHRGSGSR
jgi:hypothetical protein